MSADGGHFGQRSVSLNTILAVDHLRTIDDMFAILADWFQRRRFKNFFPIESYAKICLLKVAILDGGQGHRTQFRKLTT
jgi:hypothetical protein